MAGLRALRGVAGLLAGAALLAASPAWAGVADPVTGAMVPAAASDLPACEPADPARVAADQAKVDEIMAAFGNGGFPVLKSRLPDLKAIVSHAPKVMHRVELCDGRVIVHADSMEDYLVIAAAYPGRDTEWRTTPYPMAMLLTGSTLVEYRKYPDAIKVLLRAVALTPDNGLLAGEAVGALGLGKRFDEAIALADKTLADYPDMPARYRARLLRGKGFALSDQRRFDEAEAAYGQSLELEPGNATALGELRYIAGQRRGAPPVASQPVSTITGQPNKH
ncbi:MAG: hypothetical protein JWP35_2529 [Caulobacter sp.]|nr:hypothetical protein [Caulobacter sp.]